MSETAEKTVTITEPVVNESKSPTRTELEGKGWSKTEIDAAEKHGMVEKPEKKEDKTEVLEKTDAETKPEAKKEEVEANPKANERKDERRANGIPDFTFKTPEQEKAFLDAFGPGTVPRAMYFRAMNERKDRQKAQAERDRIALENQNLRDRLETLEKKPNVEIDENGNEIDPEDKPLTPRMLKEIEEKKAAEQQKQQEEFRGRGERVAQSLKEQEEYAKSLNPDFEDTLNLAREVMQNLDEVIADPKTQKRAIKLMQDLQVAAANADKLSLDDYNAADISYEIGKLHPNWGKGNGTTADTNGKSNKTEKANGSLTPEQMKRIETNTQRRGSSASVTGSGGHRTIAVEDVTAKDVLKMSRQERDDFRKKYPEKMRELLRG